MSVVTHLTRRIMNDIKISVIMCSYNCGLYIREAIESILKQTISCWELLICDDSSSDNTWQIIDQYMNKYPDHIHAVRNNQNRRQGYSRNRCLRSARGKYVAIMDGDDRCSPDRLKKQYDFLESHAEFAFVGTAMSIFDENGEWGESIPNPEVFPFDLARDSGFIAASCMFRKEILTSVGGYKADQHYFYVEDYDLFQRLYAKGYRGANLLEKLYQYREYRETIRRRKMTNRLRGAMLSARAVKMFHLPKYMYVHALNRVVIGLVPQRIYIFLHRTRRNIK